MAKQQRPRKQGRPALSPGDRKLPSVGFRPTPGLKARLDQAAVANGRSVSKEIESQLELAYARETAWLERAQAELGGAHNYGLAKTIGVIASFVESATGQSWVDNKVSREHLVAAITVILDRLKPPSVATIEAPAPLLEMIELGPPELRGHVGAVVAESFLDQICMSRPAPKSENVHQSRELQAAGKLAPFIGDLLQPPGSRKAPSRRKKG